ncbi:uncharacterized protein DDB_G0275275-like isoform X1 [Cotesia glomerata]|nr:uncharacterized protein DDB_G0275275-like isoform X1 [Cotesia glomerata]
MEISLVVLFFLFYTVYGEYNQIDTINSRKCTELCNYCGGTGSYVDNSCECYIENDNDQEGECFDRMKRKAHLLNFDLINCKRGLPDRPSRCRDQNSRRIGSYDMCRIAQYFLSGGPAKRIPIVKSKCDPTTTTSTSTEPTVETKIIDELECDEVDDDCNLVTEPPIEDPCEKYKLTPRPPEYLEPRYDYPKPLHHSYIPNYHTKQPLRGSTPPSYTSFHNRLYQGNNQLYSPQYSSFGTNLQQTTSPYDAMSAKYMEEMMGRNYYNSMMENQPYRNKINGYNYNTFSTNGYLNAMIPFNNNNYMQSLYASTNSNNNYNNNNNYQLDSTYLQSMSMNDLLELERYLTNQNLMMQPLLQRLQLQSNSQSVSNYSPFNDMVGAANPSSTDNSRNQENTTPIALTSLGSSNDETVVSSTQKNDNPMPVVIVEETVTGQVGGEQNSDSTERSRRVIRPLYNRRIIKRGSKL